MSYQWNDSILKSIVGRHQQNIFALITYLIGGDRDKVYAIASGVFSEVLRKSSPFDTDSVLLTGLVCGAIEKCRDMKAIPYFDDSDLAQLPAEKAASLRIVRTSLQSLPFEPRALLLLRDQIHLSYKQISSVLGVSENDARLRTIQARAKLREAVEEVISHGG